MYDFSYSAALLQRRDLPQSGSHQIPPPPPPPPPTQARTCRVFATIREPARGTTTTTVCDMRGRVVNVFTSDADRIELRIMTVTTRSATSTAASFQRSPSSSRRKPSADASRHEPDNYVVFRYTGDVLFVCLFCLVSFVLCILTRTQC